MIKVDINDADKKIFQTEIFNQFHPIVMRKMDALRLKSFGLDNSLICEILKIHYNTLLNYFHQYLEGGIARLQEIKLYRPTSSLSEHSVTIASYFAEHPPSSISAASAKIEELTGIVRSESAVRKFLKDLNFRYRKAGSVPSKTQTESKKKSSSNFWTHHFLPE